MATDIASIVAAIATIETGITPPAGQPAAVVLDSPPQSIVPVPAWLNLEDTVDLDEYRGFGINAGELVQVVNAYLILPATDLTSRLAFRRLWQPVGMDAFESDTTKLGGTVRAAWLGRVAAVTVQYAGQEFYALKFPLRCIADRA